MKNENLIVYNCLCWLKKNFDILWNLKDIFFDRLNINNGVRIKLIYGEIYKM